MQKQNLEVIEMSDFFDDIISNKLFDDMEDEEVLNTDIDDVIEALYT